MAIFAPSQETRRMLSVIELGTCLSGTGSGSKLEHFRKSSTAKALAVLLLPILASIVAAASGQRQADDGRRMFASSDISRQRRSDSKAKLTSRGEWCAVASEENLRAAMKQANRSILAANTHPAGDSLDVRCEDTARMLSGESVQVAELLARYYRIPGQPKLASPPPIAESSLPRQPQQQQQEQTQQQATPTQDRSDTSSGENLQPDLRPELPRPLNVTVLIISWSPPILKLQWKLNELDDSDASRLDFYHQLNHRPPARNRTRPAAQSPNGGERPALLDQFDLELSITEAEAAKRRIGAKSPKQEHNSQNGLIMSDDIGPADVSDNNSPLEEELRMRRVLVDKSLSCFQVTYNIINSRFKVTEEYPPYLRSVMLERLLPATEYSLHVVAVYLGGRYRTFSQRVQFVSPTDNESRRFKENTYRPIHRYPDEKRELRIGLAQVRSEELTIVVIAVIFWIATICLFFNKWGKIRMLEPYQPAYREISPTASFAHTHHPSAHNLPNSAGGTGSCGTGSGPLTMAAGGGGANLVLANPKLAAGLCGADSVAIGGASTPTGLSSPVASASILLHGGATPAVVATPSLEGPAPPSSLPSGKACQPAAAGGGRSSDGQVLTGGKAAGRSLLLMGNKRFESIAGETALSSSLRRTDTELNYLFQSKALALAKATSLWSRQQQKLRQLQYRAHLPASLQQQPSAAAAAMAASVAHAPDQQLEMLRRTSQALLRQRQLSHCPAPPSQAHLAALAAGASNAAQPPAGDQREPQTSTGQQLHFGACQQQHQPSTGSRRKASEGCEPRLQTGRATPTRSDLWPGGRGTSVTSGAGQLIRPIGQQQPQRTIDTADGSPRAGTKSLDWNDGEKSADDGQNNANDALDCGDGSRQRATAPGSGSSNRMRRLLFITKSHQHHHIATSNSSSLLKTNSASLPNNNSSTNGSASSTNTTFRAGKMNSTSLDNAASGSEHGAAPVGCQKPAYNLDSGSSSSSLPAKVRASDETLAGKMREDRGASRPPLITMVGTSEVGANKHQRPSLVEHHILIEPPSPPMQRDLLEQPVVVFVEGQQQRQQHPASADSSPRDDPSGGFFEDPQPNRTPAAPASRSFQSQPMVAGRQRPLAGDNNKSQQEVTIGQQRPKLPQSSELTVTGPPATADLMTGRTGNSKEAAGEWLESDKEMEGFATAMGPNRGLNYNEGAADSLAVLTPPGCLEQPEICLEAPADERELDSGPVVPTAAAISCQKPNNEPFVKLASYQVHSAAIRRKLGPFAGAGSGGPTGSLHSFAEAAGATWTGSQVSHCLDQCGGHSRHQSFRGADCGRLSPQASHSAAQAADEPGELGVQCGRAAPSGEWLALSGSDELAVATTVAGNIGLPSCGACSFGEPLDQQQQCSRKRAYAGGRDHHATARASLINNNEQSLRPRMSSVFVASPYSRAHRDSFAMLRALSQKKSKSAEDVAYLSSLVLQIWTKDRNPLLQSVSQQQLSNNSAGSGRSRSQAGSQERQTSSASAHSSSSASQVTRRQRPKSSLTVAHI